MKVMFLVPAAFAQDSGHDIDVIHHFANKYIMDLPERQQDIVSLNAELQHGEIFLTRIPTLLQPPCRLQPDRPTHAFLSFRNLLAPGPLHLAQLSGTSQV